MGAFDSQRLIIYLFLYFTPFIKNSRLKFNLDKIKT